VQEGERLSRNSSSSNGRGDGCKDLRSDFLNFACLNPFLTTRYQCNAWSIRCTMSDSGKDVSSNHIEIGLGSAQEATRRSWIVGFTSLLFILLQSACTAVMAISGVRVLIGLGALAAAAGLHAPATGFHGDAIRIPMMVLAVGGSFVNLYVIWRIRSLRARPASQWRVQPISAKQKRSESLQIGLAILTLVLVAAEYATHLIVHGV
jgi:hypothetical protein